MLVPGGPEWRKQNRYEFDILTREQQLACLRHKGRHLITRECNTHSYFLYALWDYFVVLWIRHDPYMLDRVQSLCRAEDLGEYAEGVELDI